MHRSAYRQDALRLVPAPHLAPCQPAEGAGGAAAGWATKCGRDVAGYRDHALMDTFRIRANRAPGRLSDRAVLLLRAIVGLHDREGRPVTVDELRMSPAAYASLLVLEDRSLVSIRDRTVAPRVRGRELLRQSTYRDVKPAGRRPPSL